MRNPLVTPVHIALAVSSLGAVAGTTFSVMSILTIGDIGGALSVSSDDAAWFNTLYNVGAICGLPIIMTMAASFGRGRAMFFAGLFYTLCSIAVACSPYFEWALVARFLHGFFGGMLPVMMMQIVMTSLFPGKGQLEGMTLFALMTSIGTGLAASLGGFLLTEFGWRGLFGIQALVGIIYTLLASRVFPGERGDQEYLSSKDWPSYVFLAVGLSGLMIVMAEGERRFWGETWWIPALFLSSLVGLGYGAHSLWVSQRPLLVLKIFRRPTFTWAIILSFVFRFGTLLSIWIAPQYLARMQGFKALQTGDLLLAMVPSTIVGFVLAYWLVKRIDSRMVLSLGLLLFALAAALCTNLAPDWSADQFRTPIIIVGLGQAFVQVALLRYAVFGIGKEEGPTCGIIFNLARLYALLGGLGGLWHLVTEREKYHYTRIAEVLSTTETLTAQRIADTQALYARYVPDGVASHATALAKLSDSAMNQAYTLAYGDAFFITTVVMFAGAILVWALPTLPNSSSPTPQPAKPETAI